MHLTHLKKTYKRIGQGGKGKWSFVLLIKPVVCFIISFVAQNINESGLWGILKAKRIVSPFCSRGRNQQMLAFMLNREVNKKAKVEKAQKGFVMVHCIKMNVGLG